MLVTACPGSSLSVRLSQRTRLGSPAAAPPQCEKRRDAEGEQPERRRFRHRYDGPDASAAVRLVPARIRRTTRRDDGRRMPEVGRVPRHGRVRQLSHFNVPQLRVGPRFATRRLRRGVIVVCVIRESAWVHVMTRYAVRVQHAREEKRGDHGCQCTNRRCAQGMVKSMCLWCERPNQSRRLFPMGEYAIAPRELRMRSPAQRSSHGFTKSDEWDSTEYRGAQPERRNRTK
jgi:hypothetical protein